MYPNEMERAANIQLDDIPDEIILKILSNLDITDLLRCAQVSKRINMICIDETLYHEVNLSRSECISPHEIRKIPTRIIESILRRGCKILSVRFSTLEGKFSEPLPDVLKQLDLFGFQAQNGGYDAWQLLNSCNSLERLILSHFNQEKKASCPCSSQGNEKILNDKAIE